MNKRQRRRKYREYESHFFFYLEMRNAAKCNVKKKRKYLQIFHSGGLMIHGNAESRTSKVLENMSIVMRFLENLDESLYSPLIQVIKSIVTGKQ